MASFSTAYKIVKAGEGYYAFLAGDKGGQTYGGIARNFFPSWSGWKIVDDFVKKYYQNDPKKVPNNTRIHAADPLVESFFRTQFWDANNMDLIKSQDVANILFDFQVNSGSRTANKKLQLLLGVPSDGIIGADTLNAINKVNPVNLHNQIKETRRVFYISLGQENFIQGWLKRLAKFPTLSAQTGTATAIAILALILTASTLYE